VPQAPAGNGGRSLTMDFASPRDVCIVVYPQSYLTVRHFVDYLCATVERHSGRPAQLRVVDRVDRADAPAGSVVLIVGYKFPRFQPQEHCYTAILNFSVMYPVRSVWRSGWDGLRMMRHKRRLFLDKLPGVDAVLDFYPRHAERLRRRLGRIPVLTFPVNVAVDPQSGPQAIADCDYDVCIVGQTTARRARIFRELERNGVRLSPARSDDFPGTIGRSKLVLNVRSHRYDNLEVPRIVTSLAMGRVVVTEQSVGLEDVVRTGQVWETPYSGLVDCVLARLADVRALAEGSREAQRYMREDYGPACDEGWSRLLTDLAAAADSKLRLSPEACGVR